MNRRSFVAALAAMLVAPKPIAALVRHLTKPTGPGVHHYLNGRWVTFREARKLPPRLVTLDELNRAFRRQQPILLAASRSMSPEWDLFDEVS